MECQKFGDEVFEKFGWSARMNIVKNKELRRRAEKKWS